MSLKIIEFKMIPLNRNSMINIINFLTEQYGRSKLVYIVSLKYYTQNS